ncbi:TetR family transcriptional regulator [Kribbella sandramycini]|uniref:AcrR family transcriptional regulator n=1 Tax=Kribbella sandramycini TaxID=60450 RepID=A0A7Y4P174_9ACTN|nr:TetR family transcriptional regulator [Kribbella sandramycini]MBB6565591.1 AcrR family transcriptional regulator [Kribbella sandramycini]NOL41855.1 TetR family transcriptional regulator [Kribbella sandramycini]
MTERKSDRTRAAILAAARERFGGDGYERATIRAIAADAAIDPAMVIRYFGTKEKLFAAAAEFDLRLPALSPGPGAGEALVRHFLVRWEDDDTLKALLRSAVTNPQAADRMRELFATQLAPALARLAVDDPATRAGLVATQALGFALCRYILELPPVAALSHDAAVAALAPAINHYLTEPLTASE